MEANFMYDIADIYKCIVCHLALKEPVLIIECGHRLCKLCFENLCKYATEHNDPILCPHDRKEIDQEKVVDDKGVGRTVLDLQVYCENNSEGCTWSGELRHLEEHVKNQCKVMTMKKFMDRIEKRLDEKDAAMEELQKELSLKDNEMQKLKKDSDERIAAMEQRFKGVETRFHEKDEEIALLKYELSSLRLNILRGDESNANAPTVDKGCKKRKMADEFNENEKENVTDFGNADGGNASSTMCSESEDVKVIKPLKLELIGLDKRIALLELKNANVTSELYNMRDVTMKDKGDQDGLQDINIDKQIRRLEEIVLNVDTYIPNSRTVFTWKLRNYAFHENLGKAITSPEFYSTIRGQCCCLSVDWNKKKTTIGLFIRFRSGNHEPENDFFQTVKKIVLSAADLDGRILQKSFPIDQFKAHQGLLTIDPGNTESEGVGIPNFLKYPALANYIVDDVMTMTCEFKTN